MSKSDETSPFFASGGGASPDVAPDPIFRDKLRSKNMKLGLAVMFGFMALAVVSTIIASSVQSYLVTPLYVLLLINVLAVAIVPIFLVYFVYSERLPKKCIIAVFVVIVFTIIEAINTDIIVLTIKE